MEKVPFSAILIGENGKEINLNDGVIYLGRGKYDICDQRISRKQLEIHLSKETKTITVMPLGINPSFLLRENDAPHRLNKDSWETLQNNDVLCLIENAERFQIKIQGEGSKIYKPSFDFEDEQATQIDPGAILWSEEIQEFEKLDKKSKRTYSEMDSEPTNNNAKRIKFTEKEEIQIKSEDIKYIKVIGVGTCGEVSEALWKGTKVAVKKIFRTLLHGDTLKEFQIESDMLRRLRHPNVVLFMGTAVDSKTSEMCIVTEFMRRGSLRDVLSDIKNTEIPFNLKVKMAIDAATGMNYLHSYEPPIIHRDLKSHNLLVGEGFTVKVTDFGLARFNEEDNAKTFCGTLPWTAPEIFGGTYTIKADIYSFGIVLWELLTREEPYTGIHQPQIIVGVSQNNLRPQIPSDCPKEYSDLMKDCWQHDPEKRPTFEQVLNTLNEFYENLDTTIFPQVLKNSGGSVTDTISEDSITETESENIFSSLGRLSPQNSRNATPKDNWEIDSSEIVFDKEIGQGSSSSVYKASYRGQDVAVKILKDSVSAQSIKDFSTEFDVMSSIRSTYVIFLHGVITKPSLCIVTEYLPYGSLFDVLNTKIDMSWPVALKLALESAKGLNTLHCWKPQVLHGDLKTANLLVDENWKVKVSDFGLSKFKSDKPSSSATKIRGTSFYAPPETYHGQEYTAKSDVFSFGIVLWEIVNRCLFGEYKKPYSEFENLKFDYQIIIQTAKHGLRPSIEESCPKPFTKLIQNCWNADPEQRPNFSEILQEILDLFKTFHEEQKIVQKQVNENVKT